MAFLVGNNRGYFNFFQPRHLFTPNEAPPRRALLLQIPDCPSPLGLLSGPAGRRAQCFALQLPCVLANSRFRKIAWMAASQATQLEVVRVPGWSGHSKPDLGWLIHGFSTRMGGRTTVYRPGNLDLNLGFTDSDDRETVAANRGLFVAAASEGKEILGLVTLRQIHSSLIRRVSAKDIRENGMPAVLKGDGLMTGRARGVTGHPNGGLHPCSGGGPEETSSRGLSCRVARHIGAHRGKRSRPHAAGVRLQAGGSDCLHRAGDRAVLLLRWRRGAGAIRVAVHVCLRNSSARYTTPTQSGRNIPCCFSPPARRATATSVPACTWIWRRRIGGNCSRPGSRKAQFFSPGSAPAATRIDSSPTAQNGDLPDG